MVWPRPHIKQQKRKRLYVLKEKERNGKNYVVLEYKIAVNKECIIMIDGQQED